MPQDTVSKLPSLPLSSFSGSPSSDNRDDESESDFICCICKKRTDLEFQIEHLGFFDYIKPLLRSPTYRVLQTIREVGLADPVLFRREVIAGSLFNYKEYTVVRGGNNHVENHPRPNNPPFNPYCSSIQPNCES
jgi:hypothetical protein